MSAIFSSPIHKDIRSDSVPYKRDSAARKWNNGVRDAAGRKDFQFSLNFPAHITIADNLKVRPAKKTRSKGWQQRSGGNSHGNSDYAYDFQRARLQRTYATKQEITHLKPDDISSSIQELLPGNRFAVLDCDITYSFDAAASPSIDLGLDMLVEKAEKLYVERETEKILKSEYEVLDFNGDTVVKTKKAGKKSPKVLAKAVLTAEDDEDDWEKI